MNSPSVSTRHSGGPLERRARDLSATRVLTLGALAILPFLAAWVLWNAQTAFFLLFAGILFAAIIDACVRGLDKILPLKRAWLLAIVIGAILLAIAALVGFGGAYVWSQFDELQALVREQADEVAGLLSTMKDGEVEKGDSAMDVLRQALSLLPGSGEGSGGPATAVQTALSALTNAVIIFFIGCFLAVEPGLYRRGLARLFPPRVREPVDEALVQSGETLRNWLMGKLASMAMIFACTWLGLWMIGFPFAFALGLLAGLLAFIPNLGPILTYIPIALAGLSVGTSTLIYGLLVYAAAQTIESYIFTPLIQKRMVELPPALILFSQVFGGVLFGLWGIALATPIAAVVKTMLETLYIQEGLDENVEEVDPKLRNEVDEGAIDGRVRERA